MAIARPPGPVPLPERRCPAAGTIAARLGPFGEIPLGLQAVSNYAHDHHQQAGRQR